MTQEMEREKEPGTLLIVGCGYTGTAFGREMARAGWEVIGTTREASRIGAIAKAGITPLLWPGAPLAPVIDRASHLLMAAPPGPSGDPLIAADRDCLVARADRLDWVGYLSTTAVYGDRQGGWVDEETPPAPSSERGRWRLRAEKEWLELHRRHGLPVHIFRLAGIYGPGRGPFAKIRRGTARRIVKPGQVFGRIHVDDIVAALKASITRPHPGRIYNLTDDLPAPPDEVIAHAASLLGLPPPPAESFETAEMSPMARSFYGESKRVSNRRLKEELGVTLRHPDYRSGLAAILEAEAAAGDG